jgi:hypothetical protein
MLNKNVKLYKIIKNITEQNVTPNGQNVPPNGQNVPPNGQNVPPNRQNVPLKQKMYKKCNKINI